MHLQCSSCGHENPGCANFCNKCGAAVPVRVDTAHRSTEGVTAPDQGVGISTVVTPQGDEWLLNEAFKRIRMTLKGLKVRQNSDVKEEDGEGYLIPCSEVRFSPMSCSGRLRGGAASASASASATAAASASASA